MLGTPVSLLIGLILILGSVGLFFLDKIKPTYARDSDKVYAVFILIAGILALTHWEINIGESFQMLLMAGMLTTLMIENIRTREPKLQAPTQPFDNRPPRPRYNEAPPVRRGYRAELDNRIDPNRIDPRTAPPGFRGEPTRAPRMAPARAESWGDAPRAPYEEYRGPAGRLQPSPNGMPNASMPNGRASIDHPVDRPMNVDDRYADGNGRYGERPPAQPPIAQPPIAQPPIAQSPTAQSSAERPRTEHTRTEHTRTERPRQYPPQEQQPNGNRSNGDRTLNIRPLSEAPRIDMPAENA